ncbi:MAG TPA: toll/interleukin-1 receptor domain-containing protein [Solirubrobacterales bacterium]|nr:toll/interleukin-1 receptor domain-containing protein [Solirubrobacterales bacterium]
MARATDSPQRVFISYRREDSAAYAGRIYDAMVARFGESNVFMDVELAPGIDFVERITEVVSGCAALIVVIGPNWASATDEDGVQRLSDPADFVRREVVAAVQRSDVTVIPALVGKAQMPRAVQLPEELEPLARRNALELSDGRWRYDVGRLTDTLDELLAGLTGFGMQQQSQQTALEPRTPIPAPAPRPYSSPGAARLVLEGIVVAAVAAFLARWLASLIPPPYEHASEASIKHENAKEIASLIGRRGATWALVGTALGLWLGARTRRTDLARCTLLGLLIGAIAGLVGGAVFAFPVQLPNMNLEGATKENWDVASLAVTGALIGALIGMLWRPPRPAIGLVGGLVAGALIQALLNNREWNAEKMPEVGFVFGARAGMIVGVTLAVLLALEHRRAARTPLRASREGGWS